ncbi:hypothetical protein EAG_07500 [Camponotus floridanus]|uniref:Uncharacterized protein n=1 Tax=Camponotus floridanus TaxID=104421 RepID=E2A906_CAMFO|nr:hypothetical protein EAG_07500 [Camponotus floridanus]
MGKGVDSFGEGRKGPKSDEDSNLGSVGRIGESYYGHHCYRTKEKEGKRLGKNGGTFGASRADENDGTIGAIGDINKDEETAEGCGVDENGDTIGMMKKTKTRVSSARRGRGRERSRSETEEMAEG